MSSGEASWAALHWSCRKAFEKLPRKRDSGNGRLLSKMKQEGGVIMGPGIFTKYSKQVIGGLIALLVVIVVIGVVVR